MAALIGIYARPDVVAEMKRTNRDKDWPFATALGGLMIDAGDPAGWLHLHDPDVLRQCLRQLPPPERLAALRPVLRLAPFDDRVQVSRVLLAERVFWSALDELRVRIYQSHLRRYLVAVRKASAGRRDLSVADSHGIRLECALQHLPFQPLRMHGLEKLVAEARASVGVTIAPDLVAWLPAAEHNFHGL